MHLEIVVSGVRALDGRFARLTESMREMRQEAIINGANMMRDILKQEAPEFYGNLIKSITYELDEMGNTTTAIAVVNDDLCDAWPSEYVGYVINGRRPIPQPRYAKFMVFPHPTPESNTIFARSVNEGPANDFVSRAAKRLEGWPLDEVRKLATKVQVLWG